MAESFISADSPLRPSCSSRAETISTALSLAADTADANRPALAWPAPPALWNLEGSDIHVWSALLDRPTDALARFGPTLAPVETERAERFRFSRHRDRFVVGRGCLRAILASYLECDPAEIEFANGPNGKPVLAGRFSLAGLHFNQAHSEDVMLAAVTRAGPIGVDVERIRALPDAEELVRRFFSSREAEAFHLLPEDQRTVSFFNLWTRKEAWLKATGEGITHSLSLVEVAFLPDEPARLLSIAGREALAADWTLTDLQPAKDYAAALATLARVSRINCWRWPQPESRGGES